MLLILILFGVVQLTLGIAVILLHKEVKKLRYELENHSHYSCLGE